jgi:ABC-2 type transport system ATP-binding protein
VRSSGRPPLIAALLTPPVTDVLAVTDLHKVYKTDVVAVDRISFRVARNEIVGLLGPNGAGKTTSINMILGVLTPTSGSIVIDGFDIARERRQALARTNFAAVYGSLPGNLTVVENLRVFGLLYGTVDLEHRIDAVVDRFDLGLLRHRKSGVLSSGEQTRLVLAKAFLNRPTLLLLDEPTASLDPAAADDVRRRIRSYAEEPNVGILWTSHNMYEVEEVCHRVLFLSHGSILLDGDPKRLPEEHGHKTLEDLFIAVAREPLTIGAR